MWLCRAISAICQQSLEFYNDTGFFCFTIKFIFYKYANNKIIDLLNLLKVNNQWKIISRVYSRIEKTEDVTSSNPVAADSKAKGKTPAATSAAKPAPKPKKPVADDGW